MKLVFTKGRGKVDRMDVIRAGRPRTSIDCPKQGIIPHDMVHYAVEHTLNARGFLGRVGEGEEAAFRMQAEDSSDAVERLVEVVQADAWSGAIAPAGDLIEMYRVTCAARSCSMLPVDEAAVQSVRASLRDLTERWQAVPVGQSLELEF